VTVSFPLGAFVGIAGKSGSGKSSLISDTLRLYQLNTMVKGGLKIQMGTLQVVGFFGLMPLHYIKPK
jgi:excinuclease UvrABC ATPase subunit